MRKSLFISFILIFLIKCSSVSSTLEDWEEKYDSNNYWYGTAVIHKSNQENIHKVAREESINEIATQISVKINNDYKKTIVEKNYKIEQNVVVQSLQSQVNNNLEDIEIVEFKDFKDRYILLARLSKKKYYDSVKRKRENAKTLAMEYVKKASSISFQSFRSLSKAKDIIVPYMDYPISVQYNNKDENLYILIEKLISSMLDVIVLDVDSNEKKIKNFINQNPLAVKVIDRNNSLPIENIPLFSKFNNKIDSCVTNTSGECDFFIDQEHLSKDPTQYLYIGVDKSKLYNTELDYSDFKSKINITLEPINIALDIKEYNFNSSVSQSYIEPVIKEFFLKESNVIFTKDILESDLIINIKTETRSNSNKANEYGLFKAFCDSSIDVKFPGNDESILKLKVTSQAVDFQSLEQAGYKSLEKNSQIIFNETLVDLVSILTQN